MSNGANKMSSNIYKEVYGADFYLNGRYFKKIHGETYILEGSKWEIYKWVFTHEDMISAEYL